MRAVKIKCIVARSASAPQIQCLYTLVKYIWYDSIAAFFMSYSCKVNMQASEISGSVSKYVKLGDEPRGNQEPLLPKHGDQETNEVSLDQSKPVNEFDKPSAIANAVIQTDQVSVAHAPAASIMKSATLAAKPDGQANTRSGWGRTSVSILSCLSLLI